MDQKEFFRINSLLKARIETIKQSFYTLSTIFFASMCAIMLITTGLLIAEYQFFKEQSRRMLILQDEYQLYIQVFKETCLNKKKKLVE